MRKFVIITSLFFSLDVYSGLVESIESAKAMARTCLSGTPWPVQSNEVISGTTKSDPDGKKYWHLIIDLEKSAPDSTRFFKIYYSGLAEYVAFHQNKKFKIQSDGKCKEIPPPKKTNSR